VGERAARRHFLELNGNGLSFHTANNNGKTAYAVRFSEYHGVSSTGTSTGLDIGYLKFNFVLIHRTEILRVVLVSLYLSEDSCKPLGLQLMFCISERL
jgi:hypothetical protein